ncbi:MAG: hypothetical protein AAFS07_14820 [Pseudomonadota bacterium]
MSMRALSTISLIVLMSCTSTEERLVADGVVPLTGPEVSALVSGNTLSTKGDGWTHDTFIDASGRLTGRAVWNGGSETADGVWEVTEDGLYCRDWENDWAGGGYGCSRVYPAGDGGHWFIYANGSRGEVTEIYVTVSEGNTQSL